MSQTQYAVNPMTKIQRILRLFLGLFPQPLPRGVSELETFFTNFFSLYDIPHFDSYRLALATMMMQLKPTEAFKSPFWFYRAIRAAQAKETAYQVIDEDRKARNLEERQAKQTAYDAKQAVVTAPTTVAVDETNQG